MPSHPERVRRNYHTIVVRTLDDPIQESTLLTVKITRERIATAMTRRELRDVVLRCVDKGILNGQA